jgi:hypothetical protein
MPLPDALEGSSADAEGMTTKTARRDGLVVAVRGPGIVEVACACGAEELIVTGVVDDMLRTVKAFIGEHAACVFADGR